MRVSLGSSSTVQRSFNVNFGAVNDVPTAWIFSVDEHWHGPLAVLSRRPDYTAFEFGAKDGDILLTVVSARPNWTELSPNCFAENRMVPRLTTWLPRDACACWRLVLMTVSAWLALNFHVPACSPFFRAL